MIKANAEECGLHHFHGWPIRVTSELLVTTGRFEAWSYVVSPAGAVGSALNSGPFTDVNEAAARAAALAAAKAYVVSSIDPDG